MTVKLDIIDSLSLPGSPDKANEDRLGHAEHVAFVIDGATGLGDRRYMQSHDSDAAWLAEFAAHFFLGLTDTGKTTASDTVSELNRAARQEFFEAAAGDLVPRYAWPSAGFAMIRAIGDRIDFSGLGDCKALLLRQDGQVEIHSALGDFFTAEGEAAARQLSRLGRFDGGSLLGDAETLSGLRAARERHNTPQSGIWTLGMVEEAGRHVQTAGLPASDYSMALMCTDGFSSLADTYGLYAPRELMQAASKNGLAPLGDEIRRIEREIDPDGIRFPRFKQSDDATAVLIRIQD